MSEQPTPVLQAQGVHKTYQQGDLEVQALRGLDLSIQAGDFAVLAGPSGSGKTTLLNLFGALDRPTEGEIVVEGQNLSSLGKQAQAKLRRDRIGFVFQAYNLVPVLTAYENAEMIMLLQGVAPAERKRRIVELFEATGLEDLGDRFPRQLSGGQQQRVAVVRALAAQPAVVLADEPTANLDSETGVALLDTMRELNERLDTTFVFSSHDPEVIARARTLVRLRDGRVESVG